MALSVALAGCQGNPTDEPGADGGASVAGQPAGGGGTGTTSDDAERTLTVTDISGDETDDDADGEATGDANQNDAGAGRGGEGTDTSPSEEGDMPADGSSPSSDGRPSQQAPATEAPTPREPTGYDANGYPIFYSGDATALEGVARSFASEWVAMSRDRSWEAHREALNALINRDYVLSPEHASDRNCRLLQECVSGLVSYDLSGRVIEDVSYVSVINVPTNELTYVKVAAQTQEPSGMRGGVTYEVGIDGNGLVCSFVEGA